MKIERDGVALTSMSHPVDADYADYAGDIDDKNLVVKAWKPESRLRVWWNWLIGRSQHGLTLGRKGNDRRR